MSPRRAAGSAFMPLFSMEVRHQYLGGGGYDAFSVLPLGSTEKVLRSLGWAGAQMGSTFTLHADRSRAAEFLNRRAKVPLNAPDLCYAIQFRDADFAKYTELPMRTGSGVAFACSRMSARHLSAAPMVSAADLVLVQNRGFQHRLPEDRNTDAAKGELWLENLGGEKVLELPASVHGSVIVDTSILDVGLYFMSDKNGNILSFTTLRSSFNLQSYFVLSISLKYMLDLYQHNFVNLNASQRKIPGDPPRFHVTFPSRPTIWRYDFFNHRGTAAQDYAVVPAGMSASASPPVFHRVPGVPGAGGETSLAFETVSAIPLAARPAERFQLLRHRETLIPELPTPGLDFSRGTGEDGAIRSSHFIYL